MPVDEQKLDPTVPYPIHCCMCLNGKEGRVTAVAMIRGYAGCEKHAEAMRQPGFDFKAIWNQGRKNAT
jgi:hypothetical protein